MSKVFLHIGEPKTGTTFLQQVMWRNRAELSAQGIVLPGHHAQDHYRASQDLRGMQKKESDPAGSWTGEWDILAQQAQQAPAAAVISHELFSACDAEQAERAVRSLQPAEVHVVLTVRDMATLLPAEWQETVKHRNGKDWEGWLEDVIDRESSAPDRRQFWFWRVHDTLAIGALWAQFLPPERVHVIVNAPKGAPGSLLWERWAALIGADPGSVDLSRARQNTSLGMAEIEFLRRLNQELTPDVPDWFYMWNVKEAVAHRAFAGRPAGPRLVLPAERDGWAKEQAETLITGLRESGFDIIGNVDDLRPPARRAAVRPGRRARGPDPRRRGGRRRGAGRQPVPQAVPARQAAGQGVGGGRHGRPDRVGAGLLPAAEAGRAPGQQPLPGRAPAAHRGLAGTGADPEGLLTVPPAPDAAPAPGTAPAAAGPARAGGDVTVAAVVVTWNRLDLLREVLPAVLGQTRPPDRVIVVDNASTDGTPAAVRADFPGVDLVSLPRNTGGAGGFAYGLALAQAAGAGLAWLMDDDTVPEPGALGALLQARTAYSGPAPALVASKVVWTDGRPHPMNTPRVKPLASGAERAAAAAAGCVPVRSASFVSVLADLAAAQRSGLPQADYFLWNDDFEFTARLLRRSPGLLCPASTVVHKTKAFGATDADPGARFFYEVRNKVWTLRSSAPLAAHERVLYGGATLRRWARTFARSADRGTLARCLLRGLAAGVRSGPRPTAEVLAGLGVTMPPDPALLAPQDPRVLPEDPPVPPAANAS